MIRLHMELFKVHALIEENDGSYMKKIGIILLMLLLTMTLISCLKKDEGDLNPIEPVVQIDIDNSHGNDISGNLDSRNTNGLDINQTGELYLYGELHGNIVILEKELELWKKYYHEEEIRHLFMEMPYFTAELLNIWMSEDNDEILEYIDFNNWGAEQEVRDFYREIKIKCPDTIFHGTDVGHNYLKYGIKFRHYLEDNNLVDTEKYILNEEAIEQGKYFIKTSDDVYRENKMVENFIREFNKLNNESVMGIYGAAHTDFESIERDGQTVETMAYQLNRIYADRIQTVDLTNEILNTLLKEPISIDQIDVAGKTYQASYFGKMNMPWLTHIEYVEYWRLDNAYDDLKESEQTGDITLFYYYPMVIEKNQIYMMVATLKDDTTMTMYSMSDGDMKDELLITKGIIIDE